MTTEAGCPPHYWLIAPAYMGQPSKGVCRYCKAEKEFQNSIDPDVNPWVSFEKNKDKDVSNVRRIF